jgi:hypothetical protein
VYGAVPPLTVEEKLRRVFTLPEAGPLMEATNVELLITKMWNADAVLPLLSVTVRVTLYVPFTAKLVENVADVPLDGLPPVTAQA